jgi:hypothetical protein
LCRHSGESCCLASPKRFEFPKSCNPSIIVWGRLVGKKFGEIESSL